MKKPTKAQIRAVFAAMGGRTSPAKAKASRENGMKGGRPRKPVEPTDETPVPRPVPRIRRHK